MLLARLLTLASQSSLLCAYEMIWSELQRDMAQTDPRALTYCILVRWFRKKNALRSFLRILLNLRARATIWAEMAERTADCNKNKTISLD